MGKIQNYIEYYGSLPNCCCFIPLKIATSLIVGINIIFSIAFIAIETYNLVTANKADNPSWIRGRTVSHIALFVPRLIMCIQGLFCLIRNSAYCILIFFSLYFINLIVLTIPGSIVAIVFAGIARGAIGIVTSFLLLLAGLIIELYLAAVIFSYYRQFVHQMMKIEEAQKQTSLPSNVVEFRSEAAETRQ